MPLLLNKERPGWLNLVWRKFELTTQHRDSSKPPMKEAALLLIILSFILVDYSHVVKRRSAK